MSPCAVQASRASAMRGWQQCGSGSGEGRTGPVSRTGACKVAHGCRFLSSHDLYTLAYEDNSRLIQWQRRAQKSVLETLTDEEQLYTHSQCLNNALQVLLPL